MGDITASGRMQVDCAEGITINAPTRAHRSRPLSGAITPRAISSIDPRFSPPRNYSSAFPLQPANLVHKRPTIACSLSAYLVPQIQVFFPPLFPPSTTTLTIFSSFFLDDYMSNKRIKVGVVLFFRKRPTVYVNFFFSFFFFYFPLS